jgi:hypothetical protein
MAPDNGYSSASGLKSSLSNCLFSSQTTVQYWRCYIAPSAYRCTAISSFPRAVVVTSVISLTLLPVAWFSQWILSNHSHCSLLKTAHPKCFSHRVPVSPGLSPSSSFTDQWGQQFPEWSVLLHPWFLICCSGLFFCFGPDIHFPQSDGRPNCLLCNLHLYGLPEGPVECSSATQT